MRTLKYLLLLLLCPCATFSQLNYNFYISNSGSDSNSGVSKSVPKNTLAGAFGTLKKFASLNGNVSVGLESANIFNEAWAPTYPVQIGTYYTDTTRKDFAILNGSDDFNAGWLKAAGTMDSYEQEISYKGFSGAPIGNYSYIFVIEIDKELEKTAPFSARKPLQFLSSRQAVDATPGSFYEPVTNDSMITVVIHTGNSFSPNSNPKYRYEIAVRRRGVDGYRNDNNTFENLWVRGYAEGYGPIPSGANTYCNKIIFGPGAAIHHVVIKSGTINHSLFLPAAKNIGNSAVIFYDVQGLERHSQVINSIFLDIHAPIYMHTSNGINYGAMELNNVIAFADPVDRGQFISTSNNDTVIVNNTYSDNYDYGYSVGSGNTSAQYSVIKNSCFKDVNYAISYGGNPILSNVDNIFIRSKSNSKGIGIIVQSYTSLNLSNSIIHLKNNGGAFFKGLGASTSHISARGNIFICDVDPAASVTAATTNTNSGTGTSTDTWNNNVYILLKGSKIVWGVTNAATNNGSLTVQTFDEWKRQSGQDQHSLFFDLRNDPRGLQAIFIDPENGNYELANTVEGNQVMALKAGMTLPVTCFLQKPTYEEAADMIMNDKVFAINSCRKSCQQTAIKVNSSGITDANGFIPVCQGQEQTFTGSGDYKQNDISYHQSDLNARYLWWFSDGTDTSGINLNTVKHNFVKGGPTNVRLQMVDQNGCSFDSIFMGKRQSSPVVKLGADTILCNGLDVTLTAYYPGATYLWNTGSNDNSITVRDRGVYWVQAMFNGCNFRDTMEVKFENCPCNVQMPNAFSPNGDGLNDVYKPVFGCMPSTYELSVFNRYGEQVFATKKYNTFWNGQYKGKLLPGGVYVYILKVATENLPAPKLMRGSIMLIP